MDDDTPPPDDNRRRRRPRQERDDGDDEPPERERSKRRSREDDEDDEDWEADRPRRRRRRRDDDEDEDYDPDLRMVAPVNTSGLAIAAGYLGLISVLCVPAPFALLLGILALQYLRKHPKLDGKARAIFAIVMGTIFSGVMLVVGVAALVGK